MNEPTHDPARRTVIKTVASLSLATFVSPAALALPRATPPTPGKPGDFDFLTGEWTIANRWRAKTTDAWLEFPGEATVKGLLKGVVSVEELRIPARDFSGMGLRMLDAGKGQWVDYWINAKQGSLGRDGTVGSFEDGAGIFDAEDTEDGRPVVHRGVWDRIVPGRTHSWSSLVSRDGGKTWDGLWLMDWTRVA